VALGQVAKSLLDVLPVKAHTTAEYAYLRQTTRTNNAAVVGAHSCHSPFRFGAVDAKVASTRETV
jgi:hypothetical protein